MNFALNLAAPALVTDRLELWHPAAGDLAGIHAVVAPEPVRRYLGARPTTVSDEAARLLRNAGSWALYGYGTFIMRMRGSPDVIGICGVFHSWRGFGKGLDDVPEAGWILGQDAWGKGLASEAMHAVLDWFDRTHGTRRIACMIEEGHHASLRLAHALGFETYDVHEGEDGARPLVLLERSVKTAEQGQ